MAAFSIAEQRFDSCDHEHHIAIGAFSGFLAGVAAAWGI